MADPRSAREKRGKEDTGSSTERRIDCPGSAENPADIYAHQRRASLVNGDGPHSQTVLGPFEIGIEQENKRRRDAENPEFLRGDQSKTNINRRHTERSLERIEFAAPDNSNNILQANSSSS